MGKGRTWMEPQVQGGMTHMIGKGEIPLRQVAIWGWRKAVVAQELPMWTVAGGDPNPRNAPCPPEKIGNVSLETGNPEAPLLAAHCTHRTELHT